MRRSFLLLLIILLVTPLATSAQDTSDGLTIHVVQRGENLFRIALQYGATTEQLAQLNGITNVNSIEVGQRLLVPSSVSATQLTEPIEHTIQPGETLQTIADFYAVTVESLVATNQIADINTLYVGQVLTIPTETAPPPAETVAADPETPAADPVRVDNGIVNMVEPVTSSTGTMLHPVASGETLFQIAQLYGMEVGEIAAANDIADPTRIFVGQQLIIPGFTAVESTVDLPAPLVSLDVTPLALVEGRTGRVRVVTESPAQVAGTFLGAELRAGSDDGLTHTIFIGIPRFTEPGVYPLELTVTDANAVQTLFQSNVLVVDGGYGTSFITLPEDRVYLLEQAVEDQELAILQSVMTFTESRFFDGRMGLPAAAAMNDPYGRLRSYNGGAYNRFHTGADFAGAGGAPTLAAAAGRVVLADALAIRGNTVVIDHGWGVFTAYCHLSDFYVQPGEMVESGQTVGAIGSSGRATGAHLHWEVWLNGEPVDPLQWTREAFLE